MAIVSVEGGLSGNGTGAALGTDAFASTILPIYVHYGDGNDSNSGTLQAPLKTVAAAQTMIAGAATVYGVIALLPGHSEPISTLVTFATAGVRVWGLGTGSQKARFTSNQSATSMFRLTGAGVELNNLYFPASTSADALARVDMQAAGNRIIDCDFICGSLEKTDKYALLTSGSHQRIEGCSFTATTRAQYAAISVTVDHMTIADCAFDGGSAGWHGDIAVNVPTADYVNVLDSTFVNGSTVYIGTSVPFTHRGCTFGPGCQVYSA